MKSIKQYWGMIIFFGVILCLTIGANVVQVTAASETNEFVVEGDTLVSYSGQKEELVIPEKIDGNVITAISDNAFENNQKLKYITLPDTIKEIGDRAFSGCEKLQEIELSTNLETLGAYAFSDCISLKNIKIPGSLSTIGPEREAGYAFNGCTSLETVFIENGVVDTGTYTFYACNSLKRIDFPKSLKIINTWAFGYCEKIEKIDLPDGVEEVGSASFYGCKNLKIVNMPNSVSQIGTHSFRDCSSLTEIILSDNLNNIPYRAFSSCLELKEITLPDRVTSIETEAFYNSGVSRIKFPDGLKNIGERAFYKCTRLNSIFFPDNLEVIKKGAFYKCENLETLDFPKNLQSIEAEAFYDCLKLKKINLKNGIQKIGGRAFHGCSKLYKIIIPETLSEIGESAFEGCNKLVEIYNFSDIELKSGTTENGHIALFAFCIHTKPEEKTHIIEDKSGLIFYKNESISSLIAYEGEEKEIRLPKKINNTYYNINRFAFVNCSIIEKIIIPEGIKSIGNGAFYGCTRLRRVEIPKSIKSIGDYAFYNCNQLSTVEYLGTKKEWKNVRIGEENDKISKSWSVFYIEDEENKKIDEVSNSSSLSLSITSNIFLINILLTMFWGLIFIYSVNFNRTEKQSKQSKRIFIIIICLQWILISGLRGNNVGADTQNYMRLFHVHNQLNWSDVWNNFIGLSTSSVSGVYDYEAGYVLIEKIIGSFTTSEVVYKFIIASFFMIALGYYIYKDSEDPCLSFVIYEGLFYNMFSLTGYRQTIAVAIVVLLGNGFIKKRKIIWFLLTTLVAATIHRSILIFILYYFLKNKKITKKYAAIMFSIVTLTIVFRNQIFNYVKIIFGYEQYSGNYGFAQKTFLFLLVILTMVAVIQYKTVMKKYPEAIGGYNGLILMWTMMPFAMVSPTSMRLVYTFGFSLLLFIPKLVNSFVGNRNRAIIKLMIFLMFIYFVYTKAPIYQFFWQ